MENEKPPLPETNVESASKPKDDPNVKLSPEAGQTPVPSSVEGAQPKPTAKAAEAPSKPSGAEPSKPAAKPPAAAPARPAAASQPPKPPESFGPQEGLVAALKTKFSEAITEAKALLGQTFLYCKPSAITAIGRYLKETPELGYNYLVDVTAIDYPKKPERFELIYIFYSHTRGDRLILKAVLPKDQAIHTVSHLWPTANWLEREVYDMFGIPFEGHPDLKRILLPDGWHGFPLRKDYPIALQDEEWIKANMEILQ